MRKLRLASFGLWGFIGDSFTPVVAIDFAAAFGTFLEKGRVLLGRDTRASSAMLSAASISGLLSTGCEIIDFGICPTPILQFAVKTYGADGALSISGQHNGSGWNAITLIDSNGAFMDPLAGENVLDFFHSRDFLKANWSEVGTLQKDDQYFEPYMTALENFLDTESIRKCGFTVVIDPVGGAGSPFLEMFSNRLGLRLVTVNGEPSTYLARDPEPRPRNAQHLRSIMPHVQADIAFVCSSDMGRLSLVSDQGEPLSEEYTFPLIADYFLQRNSGTIVTNYCTTRILDEVVKRRGGQLIKTKVGQSNVMATLIDEEGILGGEGNGSAGVPTFSRAFDSFLMMGLVLESMAVSGQSLSEMIAELPRYHNVKRILECSPREAYAGLQRLREIMTTRGAEIELADGIRVDLPDSWVHARISHTENIVRIISESSDRSTAEKLNEEASRILITTS